MKEYHIIVINDDDSENRLDKVFQSEDEAFKYARKFVYVEYKIMKVYYHFENNKKYYDDEVCIYSEIDED